MVNDKLTGIEKAIKGNKLDRFLFNPSGYIKMILGYHLLPLVKPAGKLHRVKTIHPFDYYVRLPSHAEFLLFKSKSTLSDIRLIRYLQRELSPGDTFIEIGTKYGFYSLLAANLTGKDGIVVAIEPSTDAFEVLKLNTRNYPQVKSFNLLASDDHEEYWLFEFPIKYTDYNTIHMDPFLAGNDWYTSNLPIKSKRLGVIPDELIDEQGWTPTIVKIDAENAELKIVTGLIKTVKKVYPDFILRLWHGHRNNDNQRAAIHLLISLHYDLFGLEEDGSLCQLHESELDQYPYEDIILKPTQEQRLA